MNQPFPFWHLLAPPLPALHPDLPGGRPQRVALETSLTRLPAAADGNLSHLETRAVHDIQELLRTATQRATQAKADTTPLRCPCGQPLSQRAQRLRTQLDQQAAPLKKQLDRVLDPTR